ncbi:MAG: hemolysin III family protein [Opitutales bacterium]|nr:hemolysin III family protein [Opitutales bacterium]
MERDKPQYTRAEEIWNASTHAAGAAFSIAAIAVMVTLASVYASAWAIVSCAIFGVSMLFVYSASSFYHAIPYERAKRVLKKIDHIAIYYLIAGSYTPFLLVSLRMDSPVTAWIVFGIIWTLAILGTVLKLCLSGAGTKWWSIALYLAMGWLVVLVSGKLFSAVPVSGIVFLALGGLFYTGGVFFYLRKRRKYSHAVWHVFVLLGTVMHFFSVLFSCVFV